MLSHSNLAQYKTTLKQWFIEYIGANWRIWRPFWEYILYGPFPVVKFGKTFDMYFNREYTDQKDQKNVFLQFF